MKCNDLSTVAASNIILTEQSTGGAGDTFSPYRISILTYRTLIRLLLDPKLCLTCKYCQNVLIMCDRDFVTDSISLYKLYCTLLLLGKSCDRLSG